MMLTLAQAATNYKPVPQSHCTHCLVNACMVYTRMLAVSETMSWLTAAVVCELPVIQHEGKGTKRRRERCRVLVGGLFHAEVAGHKCDFRVYLYVPTTMPFIALYSPAPWLHKGWRCPCGHFPLILVSVAARCGT